MDRATRRIRFCFPRLLPHGGSKGLFGVGEAAGVVLPPNEKLVQGCAGPEKFGGLAALVPRQCRLPELVPQLHPVGVLRCAI